jgi:hypothetical protein
LSEFNLRENDYENYLEIFKYHNKNINVIIKKDVDNIRLLSNILSGEIMTIQPIKIYKLKDILVSYIKTNLIHDINIFYNMEQYNYKYYDNDDFINKLTLLNNYDIETFIKNIFNTITKL